MGNLDDFLAGLQTRIFDEAKEALGEKGFDRWRNPRFQGRIPDPDAHAAVKGSCGDTMEISLRFENNRVKEAAYWTDGCASSNVCGSFTAELAIGKDPDELIDITAETVLDAVGKLPDADLHCAALAAETLHDAIDGYMKKNRQTYMDTDGESFFDPR